jgi:hypothetical protein
VSWATNRSIAPRNPAFIVLRWDAFMYSGWRRNRRNAAAPIDHPVCQAGRCDRRVQASVLRRVTLRRAWLQATPQPGEETIGTSWFELRRQGRRVGFATVPHESRSLSPRRATAAGERLEIGPLGKARSPFTVYFDSQVSTSFTRAARRPGGRRFVRRWRWRG